MSNLHELFEAGEVRRLGMLPQPRHTLTRAWSVYGGADWDAPAPLPRDQWRAVSLSAWTPPINDQDGVGECASAATCNVYMTARAVAGLPHVPLSAADLYRRVCGGRDQGSLPEDNLKELISEGVATTKTVPYTDWRHEHPGAAEERALYRGLEAWLCPTAAHVVAALSDGFPVLIGYMHHDRDSVGTDGWMDAPAGRAGGHAVMAQSVVFRGKEVGIGFDNQWTTDWGIRGRAVLPLSRVEEGCRTFQAWALRCVLSESGDVPTPRGG